MIPSVVKSNRPVGRPPGLVNDCQIAVRIPASLLDRVRVMAEAEDITPSAWIRRAIATLTRGGKP